MGILARHLSVPRYAVDRGVDLGSYDELLDERNELTGS
jgi:hypothetical protein